MTKERSAFQRPAAFEGLKVLEVCPYEPPICGWVNRVKLIRETIESSGGCCEILDIGPNRRLERPGCVPVFNGCDYIRKIDRFCRKGYGVHCHVNAEYFRGVLLALAATGICRLRGGRAVVTFHAGSVQPFLVGIYRLLTFPFYWVLFKLCHAVICNSDNVKGVLSAYTSASRVHPIAAFSIQYVETAEEPLSDEVTLFLDRHQSVILSYLVARNGFFFNETIRAFKKIRSNWPNIGMIIVGEDGDNREVNELLVSLGVQDHVYLAGNIGHGSFLALLKRCALFLRTPVTDGVSSSVLEALALGTPVLASDNGSRPPSVETYDAKDEVDLVIRLNECLGDLVALSHRVRAPVMQDTAGQELHLLAGRQEAAMSEGALDTQPQRRPGTRSPTL